MGSKPPLKRHVGVGWILWKRITPGIATAMAVGDWPLVEAVLPTCRTVVAAVGSSSTGSVLGGFDGRSAGYPLISGFQSPPGRRAENRR